MRDLKARLRDIVRQDPRPKTDAPRELTYVPDPDGNRPMAFGIAGGAAIGSDGSCLVIDRLYASDGSHGRKRLESCVPSPDAPLSLFDPRIDDRADWSRRVVFFDIETTGLSGGAGTLAFLVGCGWFEDAGFRVRQYFLAGPGGEHAMLEALGGLFQSASLLVTFNGRTFDVPFMETRWAFHRSANPADGLPHFDMLPPARRLWRRRESARSSMADEGGCSLTALERSVLGVHRLDDVPGFEIPARYFYFLRTGDEAAIDGVLEHNRADIVSLAVIMAHALWLAREGPDACREPGEQLALGRLYERAGRDADARDAFERAARSADAEVRRHALAHLAARLARDARHQEAAITWQQVLEMTPSAGQPLSSIGRRAAEALAVHHEHRVKDLAAARRYAERLGRQASGTLRREVDRRLSRLDRKLGRTGNSAELEFETETNFRVRE